LLPRRLLLPAAIGAVLVGPLYRFAATAAGWSFYAATTLTPGVLDSLGMGSVLALVQERGRDGRWFVRACGGGGLLLLVSVPRLSSAADFPVSIVVVDLALAFVFTWMVARAAEGFAGLFGKLLSLRPLVYLGKISYGITSSTCLCRMPCRLP
jgi:peptidoglycan/LPS O-acetylase OafA/YrhL